MKKNITREQIVDTALELMRDKSDLHGLNLREIARTLGCAHTNLYNYFPSYNDLLWETHATLQEIFMGMLADKLKTARTTEERLSCFFEAFVDMYIDNKGWFRLLWHQYIGGKRPERDIEVIETTDEVFNHFLNETWKTITGRYPDKSKTSCALHSTQCYIAGEVSDYISGRGQFEKDDKAKAHIAREAVRIFRLCLMAAD